MPEGPEVETVVRGLQPIVGSRIAGVDLTMSKGLLKNCTPDQFLAIRGCMIRNVTRHGKWIWFGLEGESPVVVLNHLGMFGHWLKRSQDEVQHARMQLKLEQVTHCSAQVQAIEAPGLKISQVLTYSDMRSWGRFYLFTVMGATSFLCGRVGIDATAVTTESLQRLLQLYKGSIVDFLLDQSQIAGIGNMYRSEILHRAGIAPDRPTTDLTILEVHDLSGFIRDVINTAIQLRGSTISDYRDTDGNRGSFQALLRVYGRHGKPCLNCGTTIIRSTEFDRTVFYCPKCQR